MNRYGRIGTAAIVALCVAFAALRFWRLLDSCLWFDEIFSVHAATEPWSRILGFVADDVIHPPLFYILLKIWILVGGDGLISVRLFPFVFSVATLVPFLYLCRDLKLRASQVILGLTFLAANGALIKYAQEVRMYSVVILLATFSVWLFVRFFYLGKNIWLLTIVNTLLVYTHYFGWLVIVAEIVAIIALQRIKIRQIAISFGISFVSFAPWLIAVVVAASNSTGLGQNIGWINAPRVADVLNLVLDLVDPFYFQASNIEPASMFVFSLPILLVLFAGAAVYFAEWQKIAEDDRTRLLLAAVLGIVPVVTAFVVSWALPYSIWGTRHLIIVFVPLAIAGSVILTGIGPRVMRISAISLTAAAIGFALVAHAARPSPRYIWCAWETFAPKIEGPADVYAFEDLVAYDLWFAGRRDPSVRIFKVNGIEGLTEDKAYFIPRGFDRISLTDESGIAGDRFYIAFRDREWNEKHPPLRNLRERGYAFGEPVIYEANGVKAFFVEVRKK